MRYCAKGHTLYGEGRCKLCHRDQKRVSYRRRAEREGRSVLLSTRAVKALGICRRGHVIVAKNKDAHGHCRRCAAIRASNYRASKRPSPPPGQGVG